MGGATRFLVLLTTPFPLLHRRSSYLLRLPRHHKLLLSRFHHLTCSPSDTPLRPSSPLKVSNQLHNQAASSLRTDYLADSSLAPHHSHPWPEWCRFIDHISASGYFDNRPCEDEFVGAGELSHFFLREARACLAFSRDRQNILRLLSRRDIEVVVEHGSPFLFQNAEDSVRKMRSFISNSTTSVLDSDKAYMVDLMKFMLSHASNPLVSSERNNLHNRELVELSVRNLFAELFKLICNASGSNSYGAVQNQMPARFGQTKAPGPKLEMKRGDWVCPRCNFMNFARNVKCLECEEARPKRQLTGGEWECPQCDFFNYGKNITCMRCDCKRPRQIPLGATNTLSGVGYGNGSSTSTLDIDSRLAANEEKAQRWFNKVSQLDSTADINSLMADEDFPEIMPLRKGVNRFVVSTRKTPLERRLANTQYGNDGTPEFDNFQAGEVTKSPDTSISRSLDEILGRPTGISQSDSKSFASGQNTNTDSLPSVSSNSSPQYRNVKSSNSSHVPFVPLPVDMFAPKSESSGTEESEKVVPDTVAGSTNLGDNLQLSSSSNQIDSKDKEKEQAEKSESWFKKVAELHNVSDLTSVISDEDFPDIMPMRKGENRFVISKKKDRSLTSPAYKRQLAIEQARNTNYVPFVPFPPGYFAKRDKQQSDGENSMHKPKIESSSTSEVAEKLPEMSNDVRHGVPGGDYVQGMTNVGASSAGRGLQRRDNAQDTGNHDLSMKSWSPKPPGQGSSNNYKGTICGATTRENSGQNYGSSHSDNHDDSKDKYFRSENKDHMPNLSGSSSPSYENHNIRAQWTGKSLEGSAVKEPDPLDMSEEAKAERWFRRVAQIKDISELSQIPDEDFPSIMPMRKGVNRFVVSKRKTPLERRLTSQQYRKNLPVVSSDPIKKENEGS